MDDKEPNFIPLNYRTIVFCFLMGSIFSVPCGMVWDATARPFIPPTWTQPYYSAAIIGSFVLLPFWSELALRRLPLLRRIGFWTFVAALLFGLLYPAMQHC